MPSAYRQALFFYLPRGHHLSHAKLLLQQDVTIDWITTQQFVDKLDEDLSATGVRAHIIADTLASGYEAWSHLRHFLKATPRFHEVITTSFDEMWCPLFACGILGKPPLPTDCALSGIWVGAKFSNERKSQLKWRMYTYIVRKICRTLARSHGRVLFFNEALRTEVNVGISPQDAHALPCPDPYQWAIDFKDSSAHSTEPICLLAGYHSRRKGTLWALNALSNWSGPLIRVVIAGTCEDPESMATSIAKLPAAIEVDWINDRVSETRLSDLYRQATCVLLPYRQVGGSSGVFVNALAHGCPVVSPDFGEVGRKTKELRCGVVFEHDSPQSFCHALHTLLSKESDVFDQESVLPYLQENSPEAYTAALLGRSYAKHLSNVAPKRF